MNDKDWPRGFYSAFPLVGFSFSVAHFGFEGGESGLDEVPSFGSGFCAVAADLWHFKSLLLIDVPLLPWKLRFVIFGLKGGLQANQGALGITWY